jgi:hypothetical protein
LKEVKTIRNRKPIYTHVFVTALLLTLLLSLLIGIVVAPKPEKPGKPDSPGKSVKTWDIKISIGIGDLKEPEDINLTSPVHEDGIYLFAEDVPCSGGLWDLPGKGKMKSSVSGDVSLFSWEGDDCGNYDLADLEGYNNTGQPVSLGDFPLEDEDIAYVSIQHTITPMGNDFWIFVILWVLNPGPQDPEFFELEACTDPLTNWDGDPEGTLTDDVWLVEFVGTEEAEAMLFSDWTDEDADGVPDNYDWKGPVSFTVEITRSPPVA